MRATPLLCTSFAALQYVVGGDPVVGADVGELRDLVGRLAGRVAAQEREIARLRGAATLGAPGSVPTAAGAEEVRVGVGGDPCLSAPFSYPCPPAAESGTPPRPFEQFARVMAVTAHPDDESLWSGTLSLFSALGRSVRIVCLTNGDKGSGSYNVTPPELARQRAEELRRAAAELFGAEVVQLGYEDGMLENTYEARLRVAAQIRLHKPDLLVAFNPTDNFNHIQRGSWHRDHQMSGAIALDAFYPGARDHLQFKELWEPEKYRSYLRRFPELRHLRTPLLGWDVREAYLFAAERVDAQVPRYQTVVVALDDAAMERKARSLAQHVSQTGGQSWEELLPRLQNRSGTLGAASRPPLRYAEWFTRVVNFP